MYFSQYSNGTIKHIDITCENLIKRYTIDVHRSGDIAPHILNLSTWWRWV